MYEIRNQCWPRDYEGHLQIPKTDECRRLIVGLRSNSGAYKYCSSSLPRERPDLSKLVLSQTLFSFLLQKHSFFLLSNQRSFNLSTAFFSTIDLEEQPLISLYTTLPSLLDLVTQILISLSTAFNFNLSLRATIFIPVFPQHCVPFPREHV